MITWHYSATDEELIHCFENCVVGFERITDGDDLEEYCTREFFSPVELSRLKSLLNLSFDVLQV